MHQVSRHPLQPKASFSRSTVARMATRSSVVALLFASACCASCSGSTTAYTGDGRLVDHGPTAANDRYVVEAGTIDLSQRTTKTFLLKGLPSVNFVAGLQVHSAPEGNNESLRYADVEMEIKDHSGAQVVHVAGPLRNWTWSSSLHGGPSFIYERAPPDSFFLAARDAVYELTVTVRTPSSFTIPASVVLKSGGWK